jgi:hypothetical protein
VVNGQWIVFDPHLKMAETSPPTYKDETNLKMAETSGGDDISIKPGDIIQLTNRHCWIVEPPAPPPPPPPPVIPEPVGFEQLIGKQVEYAGRTYTLLDYFPACGYCQISGHGEIECVPENQVKGEV